MKKIIVGIILLSAGLFAANEYKQPSPSIFYSTVTLPTLNTAGLVTNTSGGLLGTETKATVAQGGTNSSTSLNNSRFIVSTGGAIVENAAVTGNKALASTAGGLPVASATTDTELGYLSGVANTNGGIVYGNGTFLRTNSAGSSGQPLLSGGAGAPTFGTLALANGGTGQTTKAPAFDALSPMTTGGDIIYGGSSGTGTRLANGTAGQVLTSGGGTAAPTWGTSASTFFNYLSNSAFDYWQRKGSAGSDTATNGTTKYVADRWYMRNALGTNGVLTQTSTTGGNDGSKFGLSTKITTAPTAAQTNGCELWQAIENPMTISLYNQTVVSQVKVKALGNVTQIGIQYFYDTAEIKPSTANNIGSEQTCTVTSGAFATCTTTPQALGTSMTTSGIVAIRIRITAVSSGNTYDLNNGFITEQAGLFVTSTTPTWSRMHTDPGQELGYAKRFYNKTLLTDVAVGSASAVPGLYYRAHADVASGHVTFVWSYPNMRIPPTGTIYSHVTGTASKIRDITTNADLNATIEIAGINVMTGKNSAAATVNDSYYAEMSADAEI